MILDKIVFYGCPIRNNLLNLETCIEYNQKLIVIFKIIQTVLDNRGRCKMARLLRVYAVG